MKTLLENVNKTSEKLQIPVLEIYKGLWGFFLPFFFFCLFFGFGHFKIYFKTKGKIE